MAKLLATGKVLAYSEALLCPDTFAGFRENVLLPHLKQVGVKLAKKYKTDTFFADMECHAERLFFKKKSEIPGEEGTVTEQEVGDDLGLSIAITESRPVFVDVRLTLSGKAMGEIRKFLAVEHPTLHDNVMAAQAKKATSIEKDLTDSVVEYLGTGPDMHGILIQGCKMTCICGYVSITASDRLSNPRKFFAHFLRCYPLHQKVSKKTRTKLHEELKGAREKNKTMTAKRKVPPIDPKQTRLAFELKETAYKRQRT
ncbi:hypothetical protein DIPPA_31369 [Diplonema papillatum]|nr:hypothetical protein DIPPA_31369 [Diplonema papillatum]